MTKKNKNDLTNLKSWKDRIFEIKSSVQKQKLEPKQIYQLIGELIGYSESLYYLIEDFKNKIKNEYIPVTDKKAYMEYNSSKNNPFIRAATEQYEAIENLQNQIDELKRKVEDLEMDVRHSDPAWD